MKVLWLCNTLIPEAAHQLDIFTDKPESWITGVFKVLKDRTDIELLYLFPIDTKKPTVKIGNTSFIPYTQKKPLKFEKKQILEFSEILSQYNPDVIHVFGTEYAHSYAMVKACETMNMLDKVLVSIQGMVSVIAKHYDAHLPANIIHRYTFRDLLRNANIYKQKKQFALRGKYEEKTLTLAKHVIGRTDWDKACTTRLNPNVQYHFCNETLRSAFYDNVWSLEKCEKHSMFVSQSFYPIKGFHLMLEAMADILKSYPDAHLYTTGQNPLKLSFVKKLRQTYYNKYLGNLIKKYHLENHITFLGKLDENQMCDRYLRSHVFISPSSIENSSNSVGEAMILGVPTVSSDVGGVKNLLEHGKEGFVYQADAPYMAAYYIKQIFADDELALKLSKNAKAHAAKTHNKDKNFDDLINIYNKL